MSEPAPEGTRATPPPENPSAPPPPPEDLPAPRPDAVGLSDPAASHRGSSPPEEATAPPAELPEHARENEPSSPAAERALVRRRPKIGDTRPAPLPAKPSRFHRPPQLGDGVGTGVVPGRRRRRSRRPPAPPIEELDPLPAVLSDTALDDEALAQRKGRHRRGRPVGRYLMCVHVGRKVTQIAVLEGRLLIEHYVAHDDDTQIHGNVYLGRVQNVLPGMEAAFVDIGTPKNAVLYRSDVRHGAPDAGHDGPPARIEQLLRPRQPVLCQVTKNPIGHKGARLTQEVSLPGRFVVLIPNSGTYGISKRLFDDERKRLRAVLDQVRPQDHGLIVRTAASGATTGELQRDVGHLLRQWERIEELARTVQAPALLHREPNVAVRVIREEFNPSYRGVLIDDRDLFEEVHGYVASIAPELSDRVELYDTEAEPLPLFERHHIDEQLHKALDRKVWLPSGGSLVIERTEALTVIDVNTGRNVGRTSLEETVYRNNLEAAEEIARQLRLRDVGGIIVIDFVDMEEKSNRDDLMRVFREALSRDKTRTQVFEVSELGLVQMTRRRIGEGLLEALSSTCPTCEGRGVVFDPGVSE
ncbi:MAG: Rne/Rng family ribonuclease [Actinobacteria bacterium]|nr:Rne/Rng family ribonuclease [Actinomycetota bacterium]MBW3641829.1 Rne/Rng family ribonuclease [Actinomycetota bacterium]